MTNLNYKIHPGSGPVMLLVHGFLSSSSQWSLNLPALGQVCTPVTVELYGHGHSPSPLQADTYSPENYLAEFEAIRQAIGVEQWLLCGYSLGAGLTIRYALQYPHRTIAHIFTNSTSAFSLPREESELPQQIITRFEQGGIKEIEAIPVHPKHAHKLSGEVRSALLRDARLLNPAGIGRTIVYTNPCVSVRNDLQQNIRPALLVCGTEENRFLPLREFVEVNMPMIKIVDLPAGHAVNAECSEGFDQAVVAFIQENAGSHSS